MFGRKQASPSTKPVRWEDSSLGKILVKMGAIGEQQLEETLQKKHDDDYVLGALLKEQGLCTDDQLQKALAIQKTMREGRVSEALVQLMELRVEAFGAGEQRLSDAIDARKRESEARGEQSGVWVLPFSPTTDG